MDKVASELYRAMDEILAAAKKLEIFHGKIFNAAEQRIYDNNFKFIKERGMEAKKLYEEAEQQESRN